MASNPSTRKSILVTDQTSSEKTTGSCKKRQMQPSLINTRSGSSKQSVTESILVQEVIHEKKIETDQVTINQSSENLLKSTRRLVNTFSHDFAETPAKILQ